MKVIPQLFILIFLFAACTKEIDMPFPSAASQIALNGILHPDSLISITLTKTLPVEDSQDFPIVTDAVVQLYEDDQLIGDLQYQHNAYVMIYKPQEGYKYTVEVEVPSYPVLRASEVMPYAPIANACYKKDATYSYTNVGVQVAIQDQQTESNYYWLDIVDTFYFDDSCEAIGDSLVCPGADTIIPYKIRVPYYQSYSPIPDRFNAFVDNTSGGITQYEYCIRIDDATLNGSTIALDITSFEIPSYQYIKDDKYFFTLNIISGSQHYDRYLKSSIIYFLNNESYDEANPFAEPTQIYSNVENGTGIFAAYNSVNIEVEDYPCE